MAANKGNLNSIKLVELTRSSETYNVLDCSFSKMAVGVGETDALGEDMLGMYVVEAE